MKNFRESTGETVAVTRVSVAVLLREARVNLRHVEQSRAAIRSSLDTLKRVETELRRPFVTSDD